MITLRAALFQVLGLLTRRHKHLTLLLIDAVLPVLILGFAGISFATHFLFPSVRWVFRRRAEKALARLNALVNTVAVPPRVRRATRPTYGSQLRRLAGKSQRGETKALRGRVRDGT